MASDRALLRAALVPATVLAAHLLLRAAFGALVRWPPLNLATHVLGGFAVAWFFAAALAPVLEACAPPLRGVVRAVGVFALTTTTAVTWEFFECVVARLNGVRGPSDPGDTLQDIAAGMAGSVFCLLATARRRRSARLRARRDGRGGDPGAARPARDRGGSDGAVSLGAAATPSRIAPGLAAPRAALAIPGALSEASRVGESSRDRIGRAAPSSSWSQRMNCSEQLLGAIHSL